MTCSIYLIGRRPVDYRLTNSNVKTAVLNLQYFNSATTRQSFPSINQLTKVLHSVNKFISDGHLPVYQLVIGLSFDFSDACQWYLIRYVIHDTIEKNIPLRISSMGNL